MVSINNTTISLTRGDTVKVHMDISSDGKTYVPKTGDVIKFGVKSDYSDEECIIEKTIPNDTLLLHITPDDTKDLAFGTYVWDCQIQFANGDVNTFITKAKLKILEEVV